MFISCSSCRKQLAVGDIKYHTADQAHAFCDAYCSNDWYTKNKKQEDDQDD